MGSALSQYKAMDNISDNELRLLEQLYLSQSTVEVLTQRDFAGTTGLSVGMVNAMLNRFVRRGWVTLTRLSGKKIRYGLTPCGANEVVQRSVEYLKSTVRNALLYQKRVERYVHDLAEKGYTELIFEGSSEIGYLFQYASAIFGLTFVDGLQSRDEVTTARNISGTGSGADVSTVAYVSERQKGGKVAVVIVKNDLDRDGSEALSDQSTMPHEYNEGVLIEQVALSDILMPVEDDFVKPPRSKHGANNEN